MVMRRLGLALAALLIASPAWAGIWDSYAPGGGTSIPFSQSPASQGSTTLGTGAGSALPASSIFSTFIGYNAGHSFTGATGEATCIGTIACSNLVDGTFGTALGENSLGKEVHAVGSTAIGNDSQRDYVAVSGGANTSLGKDSLKNGSGYNQVAIGFDALKGNSALATIGGTITAGDVVTLTLTGSFTGSPQSQPYTVVGGDTTTTIAANLATAINANSAIFNNALVATTVLTSGPTLRFAFPGSSTSGYGITVTSSVSGSATETVTITGGATGVQNTAVGVNAMAGDFSMSTAANNVAAGYNAANAITSGSQNVVIGSAAGTALTTANNSVIVGQGAGTGLTTGIGMVAIGDSALTAANGNSVGVGRNAGKLTAGTGGTFVGGSAGSAFVSGNNNTAVGGNAMIGAASASGGNNTALGSSALLAISSGSANTAVGLNAGKILTTGATNTIIGEGVASTTLQTGNNNILIGIDSSTDTAAAGTGNTVLIKGSGTAVLSSTGTNGTAPTTIFGGITGTSVTDAITAHAGGGQASATALTTGLNRVTVVATAADSVRLPASAAGLEVWIVNDTANAMQVFGASTDTINNVATATGVSVAAGKTVVYRCPVAGKWFGGALS
jgi:hypothetical protein